MSEASISEYDLNEIHKGLLMTMDRARNGKKFKVELLDVLAQGFPIDHKYNRALASTGGGDSLLHRALSFNSNIVQILLDAGADVNVEDHNGMNALLLAAYNFKPCYDHNWNILVPPYFREILEKTDDINKIPHRLIRTTALGLLCMKYCQTSIKSNMSAIKIAIKMLLDRGADIETAGDWFKMFFGSNIHYNSKNYCEVAEKLKTYLDLYVQQKTNFRNEQEYAGYDYEL